MTYRTTKWTFTINNYTDEEIAFIHNYNYVDNNIRYVAYSREVGDGGTHHLQGFLYVYDKVSIKWLKKNFNARAHLEPMKGTHQDNLDYCSKSSELHEFGFMPKHGKRSDIEAVKDILDNGGNFAQIIEVTQNYQCLRTAEILLKYKEKPRTWKPTVYWLFGPTGSGKTRAAYQLCPDVYSAPHKLKWFEGYDGHENVLFDDFRSNWISFEDLLKILDRYEYRIQNKGGSRQFLAKKIFITAPVHPSEMYAHVNEDLNQLLRRIDCVYEIKDDNDRMEFCHLYK